MTTTMMTPIPSLLDPAAYEEAVELLMEQAEQYGGAATGASQYYAAILLTAYNDRSWACEPTTFASQRERYQMAAMTVMAHSIFRGTSGEPHFAIQNGHARFKRLAHEYEGSRIDREAKPRR